MKLITKENILKGVVDRYRKQYPHKMVFSDGRDSETVFSCLLNEKHPTIEIFNEIIGNDSWTRNTCYECNQDKDEIIEFGVCDYDESYFRVCKDCLNEALNKINKKN